MEKEMTAFEKSLHAALQRKCDMQKKAKSMEAECKALQNDFDSAQADHEKQLVALQNMSREQLKELDTIATKQRDLVQRFETTNAAALNKQLQDLDVLQVQVSQRSLEQDGHFQIAASMKAGLPDILDLGQTSKQEIGCNSLKVM